MMFGRLTGSAGLALALALAPLTVQAQTAEDEAAMDAAFAALAENFEVEPLTAEQEARLPLAQEIVAKIIPEGTLGELMGVMFDGMLGPMTALSANDSDNALYEALGYSANDLGIDEEAAEAALAIIDPAWRERDAMAAEMTQNMMTDMMTQMEPLMRNVMAELYAIHFDDRQLADINAFFSTESGTAYARESYRMASDPRIMAAVFSEPDLLFGPIMQAAADMDSAMAELPATRTMEDLSDEEVARLSELTGLDREDIAYGMEYASSSDDGF